MFAKAEVKKASYSVSKSKAVVFPKRNIPFDVEMKLGNDRILSASSILDYIFRELAISYQNREDLAHTPSIGGSESLALDEQNSDDQNQLLKIVKDITSKGFVRNNYKKNLVYLSDIKISLKGKK